MSTSNPGGDLLWGRILSVGGLDLGPRFDIFSCSLDRNKFLLVSRFLSLTIFGCIAWCLGLETQVVGMRSITEVLVPMISGSVDGLEI